MSRTSPVRTAIALSTAFALVAPPCAPLLTAQAAGTDGGGFVASDGRRR